MAVSSLLCRTSGTDYIQNTEDIAKLLDQLSGSSAWQQALASAPISQEPGKEARSSDDFDPYRTNDATSPLPAAPPSTRVNELLKLLDPDATTSEIKKSSADEENYSISGDIRGSNEPKDIRNIPFAEALTELAKLARKPTVIKHLIEVG